MFDGKMKAVTFSFDDGVTQDLRFIGLLDKYGLKCTFNLNSELLGLPGSLVREGKTVSHDKVSPGEVKRIYSGHEIAVHTLTHPNLTQVEDDGEVVRQVEEDRLALSALTGYEVTAMAYPGGGVNADRRVAELIRAHTGVKFARTTVLSGNFEPQTDMFLFSPTAHMIDFDKLFSLGNSFLSQKNDGPAIFYIWGHTYEFDINDTWDKVEEFFSFISGKDDVFYGTNSQVFAYLS